VVAEIVQIALRLKGPTRHRSSQRAAGDTTEGGIDLSREPERIGEVVRQLNYAGIVASAFIDPSRGRSNWPRGWLPGRRATYR